MKLSPTVCVVGSANVDLTFRVPRVPGAGETLSVEAYQVGCGGKGANQAVMAARLGASVSMIGRVGADPFGKQILDNLDKEGIGTRFVTNDPTRPTGVASIIVDSHGDNRILVFAGANGALTTDEVQAASNELRTARVVLCQLETPVDATLEAFRIARAAGAITILNPAPACRLPDELLRLTDICVPNETEAAQLTGCDTSSIHGVTAAASALRQRGIGGVIVTLGSRGCLIDLGRDCEHFPALNVLAVDTTGAGDAFLGALAAVLAGDSEIREAIPKAMAAAALSVTRIGAQSSFPTRDEVQNFLIGTGYSKR